MKIIEGDILDCKESVLVQQVNHKGVMGAGLALQIRKRYPGIFPLYIEYCKINYDVIKDRGLVFYHQPATSDYLIASVFGQDGYGTDKQYTDYVALKNGFVNIAAAAKRTNVSVAIPYGIGCGLGGGDWSIVSKIIEEVFFGVEVVLYKLSDSKK